LGMEGKVQNFQRFQLDIDVEVPVIGVVSPANQPAKIRSYG
jgi:hypothetical protein